MAEPIKSAAPWSTSALTGDDVADAWQAFADWEVWLYGKIDEHAPDDDEPLFVDELTVYQRTTLYSIMCDLLSKGGR